MELSIVIVNYNSKFLLEQCLGSVRKAITGIDTEIIVVDNNSTDGSKEHLKDKSNDVTFIFNNDNVGFAKACNQGFKISSGNYVLFLNPDTILSESCLADCIFFFES
ncbi:MAG TPA: glycosyltransferase, partial [Chitinophagaceae bacterium]|nr:glycosyltransferase [Chitinophagaceae bacterium]